jgi:16S rRNA (uracil1498-N3)-methyltransferase
MHRFFVPPNWITGDEVVLSGAVAHQIRHVLRMEPGDRILVLDNSGWERVVILRQVGSHRIIGHVEEKRLAAGEPGTRITLYQSVLKSQRFEWVLQKGTELGISEFVPMISDRCVTANLEDVDRKRERWTRIIQEAAEQSHRGRLPLFQPAHLFPAACKRARRSGGLALIPWEGESSNSLKLVLTGKGENISSLPRPLSMSLFIGPEGGFTPEEVQLATGYGVIPVTLGPRILRAETAGLVAATVILYEFGDMGDGII